MHNSLGAALKARPAPLVPVKTRINRAYAPRALWNRTGNRRELDDAFLAAEAALGHIEGVGGQEQIPAAGLTWHGACC